MMEERFCLLYHVLQTTKEAVPLVGLLVQVVEEVLAQVKWFVRVYHVHHMGGYRGKNLGHLYNNRDGST